MHKKGPTTMIDVAHGKSITAGASSSGFSLRNVELLLSELVKAVREVRFVVNVPQAAAPDVILPKDAIRIENRLIADMDNVADALLTMKPVVNVSAAEPARVTNSVPVPSVTVESPKYTVFLHIIIVLLLADIALRVAGMLH